MARKLALHALVAVALIVAAMFFLFPARSQVSAAALADADCYASLPDGQRKELAPLYPFGKLWRMKESRLRREWMTDEGLSVLQVAPVAYAEVTPACRKSILGLLDAYLANGADVDMISDTRQQWTMLQGAIIMADPGLTCALLRRGASPERRFSKPGSALDGLTLVEFARRGVD